MARSKKFKAKVAAGSGKPLPPGTKPIGYVPTHADAARLRGEGYTIRRQRIHAVSPKLRK